MARVVRRAVAAASATALVVGLTLITTTASVGAAEFAVTNTNDAGAGSLRQALLDAAAANVDATIEVSDDLDDETIHLTTGQLLFAPPSTTAALEIEGNGVVVEQDTPASRVLEHRSLGDLMLREITMRGGRATLASGVGSFGDTFIVDSTLTDNIATAGDGGGVFVLNGALLTARRSTFSDNHARGSLGESAGGAIAVESLPGQLAIVLETSTVTGNSATGTIVDGIVGGGGLATGGDIEVVRSTVVDNTVEGTTAGPLGGGGTFSLGHTEVTNSTITDNEAEGSGAVGGGVFVALTETLSPPVVELVYSDMVDNSAPKGSNVAIESFVTSAAATTGAEDFSLENRSILTGTAVATADVEAQAEDDDDARLSSFASVITDPGGGGDNCAVEDTESKGWNFADDDSCELDDETDSEHEDNDPLLGELADNGGPTETMLPSAESPLVNAIPDGDCHRGEDDVRTDQRGEPRPAADDLRCDIGSVEIEAVPVQVPPVVVIEPTFTG
jgi:hypothetical protein